MLYRLSRPAARIGDGSASNHAVPRINLVHVQSRAASHRKKKTTGNVPSFGHDSYEAAVTLLIRSDGPAPCALRATVDRLTLGLCACQVAFPGALPRQTTVRRYRCRRLTRDGVRVRRHTRRLARPVVGVRAANDAFDASPNSEATVGVRLCLWHTVAPS